MPPSHTGGLKVSLQLPLQLKSLQTTGGTSGDKVFNALSLLAMPHVGDIRSKKSPLLRKPHPATRGKIFYRKNHRASSELSAKKLPPSPPFGGTPS